VSKRINVSINKENEAMLDHFDACCRAQGLPRSAAIVQAMDAWILTVDSEPTGQGELAGAPPPDDVIPEWLL